MGKRTTPRVGSAPSEPILRFAAHEARTDDDVAVVDDSRLARRDPERGRVEQEPEAAFRRLDPRRDRGRTVAELRFAAVDGGVQTAVHRDASPRERLAGADDDDVRGR